MDGDPAASRLAVTIPLLAMLGAVAVLVGGSRIRLSDVAVALAATTVLTAAVRMHHAFRNIMKVADLRRQAGTDDLTGLPNRRAFCERAAIELEALANEGSHAVLLLDLDRFKQVNDSLGHHAGDELLVLLARRLAAAIRACDTLARLGGDEFAVLLPGTSAEEAARQASHLRAVVVAPFEIGGQRVRCDVSIGIALAPAHGRDLSGLLRCADVAMYRAKQAKQGWLVYRDCEGNPNVEAHRDEVTEKDVRLALQRRELVLHYQPMIRLNTWAVCGVEALVRWRHPRKGLIRPADFLPIVEEAGLSLELTAAVLGAALDDAAQWWSRGQLLSVAINVSADLLVQDELTESLMPHLVARGLPPAALTIEISEGCISADPDWVSTVLRRLRESGMRIALDDFGTGHSSLARLRDLPVDAVKLDKSFLPAIGADPRAAGLVASVAHLAHGLDLELVAEGVGDAPTLLALTRLGCDQAQGHYLGRPMPAGDLLAWLELHRTGDTATEPSAGTTARASVRAATEATGLP